MTNFQEMVAKAVCDLSQELDKEYGIAVCYNSDMDDNVLVHLLELDGTNLVTWYCRKLDNLLPNTASIGHNSPTNGTLLIVNEDRLATAYDPHLFLTRFADQARAYIFEKEEPWPTLRQSVYYFACLLERYDGSFIDLIEELDSDMEILYQLLAIDHKWPSPGIQLATKENTLKFFQKSISDPDIGEVFLGVEHNMYLYKKVDLFEAKFIVKQWKDTFFRNEVTDIITPMGLLITIK